MPTASRQPSGEGLTARRRRAGVAVATLSGCLALLLGAAPGDTGSPEGEATAPMVAHRESATATSNRMASASPVVNTRAEPVSAAKQAILDCQARFKKVDDYTCTFVKRERLGGKLAPQNVMQMKVRTQPLSVYFKFKTPNKGREAIYVAGRNKNHVIAHDVGLFKVLAGTMALDPKGEMAMDGCRHPITEAGIGALIDTVARHWALELTPEESVVSVQAPMHIGKVDVTMIESTHPAKRPEFLFHKVKLYIDHATGLPVRFEAYDWPRSPGAAPELVEEYTYLDLKLNVGLGDHDFDPANRSYSFGRF